MLAVILQVQLQDKPHPFSSFHSLPRELHPRQGVFSFSTHPISGNGIVFFFLFRLSVIPNPILFASCSCFYAIICHIRYIVFLQCHSILTSSFIFILRPFYLPSHPLSYVHIALSVWPRRIIVWKLARHNPAPEALHTAPWVICIVYSH